MDKNIGGVVTITNTDVVLRFMSSVTARHTFENMQKADNAPHMTLWVRSDSGRCDFITFAPNGG